MGEYLRPIAGHLAHGEMIHQSAFDRRNLFADYRSKNLENFLANVANPIFAQTTRYPRIEGIVAKRKDGRYDSTQRQWLRILTVGGSILLAAQFSLREHGQHPDAFGLRFPLPVPPACGSRNPEANHSSLELFELSFRFIVLPLEFFALPSVCQNRPDCE
jgi:hypothetical protein